MRNKNYLYFLAFVIIIVILGSLGVYSNNVKTSLINIDFNDENTIKLENVVEKMYITIIDSNSEIASTNNPDLEVSNYYKYNNQETIPDGKIKPSENYYINIYLSKITDFDSENGIEENKNYYFELPSNIIPSNKVIVGAEGGQKEPSEFLTNNDVKAYGGIYEKDNKYYFIFSIKELNNQVDIKMSYQFSCKILDDGTKSNYKYMDFGTSSGIINYYYDLIIPPQSEYADLSSSISWKSSSEGLSYLDIYVKHEEDNYVWDKPVEVEYGDNFSMVGHREGLFDPSITIDGVKCKLSYIPNKIDGESKFVFYSRNCDLKVLLKPIEYETGTPNTSTEAVNKALIYFYRTFDEETFEGETLTGNHDISIRIINDRYNITPQNYTVSVKYGDEKIVNTLNHTNPSQNIVCSNTNVTLNNTGTNEKISMYCFQSNSNYISFDYKYSYPEPTFTNYNYIDHYLRTNMNTPSVILNTDDEYFKITIGGKKISFNPVGNSLSKILTGQYSNVSYVDYLKIVETIPDINIDDYFSSFYLSTELNPDGKPYIIALPKESYEKKNSSNSDPNSYLAKLKKLTNPSNSVYSVTPETLKFYIFNSGNENISIEENKTYLTLNYKYDNNTNSSSTYNIELTTANDMNSIENSINLNYNFKNYVGENPFKLKGAMLENGVIRWDGLFNKNTLKKEYTHFLNYNFYTYELSSNLLKNNTVKFCYNSKYLYPCNPTSNNEVFIGDSYGRIFKDNNNNVKVSFNSEKYTDYDLKYNYYYSFNHGFKFFDNALGDIIFTSALPKNVTVSSTPQVYNADGVLSFYYNKSPDGKYFNTNVLSSYFGGEGTVLIPGIKSTVSSSNSDSFSVDIISTNYKYPNTFNGDFVVKDYILATNLYDSSDNVIASNIDLSNYIKLKEMKIVLDDNTYKLSELTKDLDGVYELGNGKLFGLDTKLYLETNVVIGENTGINDGIDIKIHNLDENQMAKITIDVQIDYISLLQDLSETYNDLHSVGITNKVKYNSLDGEILSDEKQIKINASLRIVKDSNKNITTSRSLDTRENSETINIGYIDTDVLYVTDFLSYFRNYSPRNKDFNNQYDSKEFINEFVNNYLEVKDLEIEVIPYDDNHPVTVYKNGSFIDDYSSSTIVFKDSNWNSGELFKLELRKNNEKIKGGTEVVIKYNTILKIDAFRPSNYYDGLLGYIVTNSQVAIPINGVSSNEKNYIKSLDTGYVLEEQEGFNVRNYQDYKDIDNNIMVCYASTGAGGSYLKYSVLHKDYKSSGDDLVWEIEFSIGSAGKDNMFSVFIRDELEANVYDNYPESSLITDTEKREVFTYLNNLILKNVTYSDINVYLNDKNTPIISMDGDVLETISQTYSRGTMDFTINNKNDYLNLEIPYRYEYKNFLLNYKDVVDYDSTLYITYKTRVDWNSFIKEAFKHRILHDIIQLYKGENKLVISFDNKATTNSLYDFEAVAGAGNIMVYNYSSNINKTLKSSNADGTSTWELSVDSKNEDDITINDEFEIVNELLNQKDLIKNSYSYDNFAIKYGDVYAFKNNTYENGFTNENIKINTSENNKLSIVLHNTDNKKFLGQGEILTIVYDLKFDTNKFVLSGGIINDKFKLINNSNLDSNNNIISKSDGEVDINLGIPNPLSKTREESENGYEDSYTINYANTNIIIKNLEIKDVLNIQNEYLEYFNYKDIVIKKYNENNEDTIIYDKNNQLPNGYHLLNLNNDNFDINKDKGFILKIDSLGKNEKIIITYNLKVNYDKYFKDGNIGNNTVLIENTSTALSSSFNEPFKDETNHNFIIKEHFYKDVIEKYKNSISWGIHMNLLTKYDSEYLKDKKLIITDKLEKSLACPSRVNGYYYKNNNSKSTRFNPTFECEDNILKITINDLSTYHSFDLNFLTNVTGSVPDVKNSASYALISQDDKIIDEIYTETGDVKSMFSAKISALLTSRGVAAYSIKAYKYLDKELTDKKFNFYAYECDSEGNKIDGGFESIVQNDNEGKITFDAINYKKEGVYYYKIGEVLQESQKYLLDDSNYILKVEIGYSDGKYIVKNTSIEGFDSEETINFYNYTLDAKAPEEEFKEVPKTDIPIYPNNNPRLKNNNKLLFVYLIVVSSISLLIIYIKNNKSLKYNLINKKQY